MSATIIQKGFKEQVGFVIDLEGEIKCEDEMANGRNSLLEKNSKSPKGEGTSKQ
jgi:hypothetical protein